MRLISIALIMFFSTGAFAFEKADCVFEGNYNLSIFPWSSNSTPRVLQGLVGKDVIQWQIHGDERTGGYYIFENHEGILINLQINLRSQPQYISGWVKNQYIAWTGNFGLFTGVQTCP